MTERRGLTALLLLATSLTWGTSFLFNEIALRDVPPVGIAGARLAVGALTLWLVLTLLGRGRETVAVGLQRSRAPGLALVGLLTAAPFTLIALAQTKIESGVAGIANAAVPLFAALLTVIVARDERPTPALWVGLLTGFAGVVFLTVGRGLDDGATPVVGILVSVSAAAMYASGAVFTRVRLRGVRPSAVAAWTVTWGAAIAIAPAALAWPAHPISTAAAAALLALGVLATGAGVFLYYTLLERAGAARAATVNYLLPVWAVIWGTLLLDEPLRPAAIAALALILTGTAVAARSSR